MSHRLVRIFPNDARIRYRNSIHEFVALDGNDAGLPSDRTDIEIVHHGYLSAVVAERAKGERNLRLSRLAAERDPDDSFHQYNLGMASLLAGDHAMAIAALDRTRELTRAAPRGFRIHALVMLADLYLDVRGDTKAALALVEECLGLVPTYSNAHFSHGKLLAREGQFHAARDAFGRAISAGSHDGEQFVVDDEIAIWKAHNEIGATLMRERRFRDALAWFELAAKARPAVQALFINRARCHEALGELSAARAMFVTAFTTHRDSASAIEWVNFLLRCDRTAVALAAMDVALPLIDDASAVTMLGTAAAVHLRARQRSRAQVAVDRALERGNRAAAVATIEAMAKHMNIPELAELLPISTRAIRTLKAYVS